jgi:hypothetical protein
MDLKYIAKDEKIRKKYKNGVERANEFKKDIIIMEWVRLLK